MEEVQGARSGEGHRAFLPSPHTSTCSQPGSSQDPILSGFYGGFIP